jgi:penicillin G amidase
LGGPDIQWASYLSFLKLKGEPGWNELWTSMLKQGQKSSPSIPGESVISLEKLMGSFSRIGSNSMVVSGDKARQKAALISSDPHLGIFAPNLWVLMGYKSPSFHVLGLMLPGVPVVTVGRNQQIAWGGTYMRGVSSHLFKVADSAPITIRKERIKVRAWFDRTVNIEESALGPIVLSEFNKESKKTERVALNWVGHQVSNELGAFLKVNAAENWKDFREAFKDFAVAGLNMTYADTQGNIGFLPAIRLPVLLDQSEHELLVKSSSNKVIAYKSPLELPSAFNPKQGFFASANNMPAVTKPPLAWGTSDNDRIERLKALALESKVISLDQLKKWQLDDYSSSAHTFNQKLLSMLDEQKVPLKTERALEALRSWDGRYNVESLGAVAFEMLTWQMAIDHFEQAIQSKKLREKVLSSDDWRSMLDDELMKQEPGQRAKMIVSGLKKIEAKLKKFKNWGDYHQLTLQSPLGIVPVLGSRFRYGVIEAAGSSRTLNKAAFSPGFDRRAVTFGAQSRHLSDMSGLNENYFTLLGGNDGWLNNDNLVDQVPLWTKGDYIKVPLELSKVRQVFSYHQKFLSSGIRSIDR